MLFIIILLAILVRCWSRYIYICGSDNKQKSYRESQKANANSVEA